MASPAEPASNVTITFYSTQEQESSKYPTQFKKSINIEDSSAVSISNISSGGVVEAVVPRSRSGRVLKKPDRYEPVETVIDDYD